MASKRGKLLQLFSIKRKGSRKTSLDDNFSGQDVTEVRSRRERKTNDGETVSASHRPSSVDHLEKELLELRQSLERKDAEMQKLKNEVSTLRIMTTVSGVQPEPKSQELSVSHDDMSEYVNGSDSFRSDASQLSCLEFSLASTGNLELEGKIKTNIIPQLKRIDQTASILSETAKAPAPRSVEKLDEGNDAFTLEERSTTKGTVSSHVQEDIVDKLVGVTKIRVNASKVAISNPEYVGKYCHSHSGGDLKFPESVVGLETCSGSYICETDDECFDLDAYQSRSPPKSTGSTEEQDAFVFASPGAEMYLDSDNFFTPQTAGSLQVASFVGAAVAGPNSSCALADLEVGGNSLVVDMKDHEEAEQKAPKISEDDEAKNSIKVLTSSITKGFGKDHGQTILIPSSETEINSLVGMVETGLKVASMKRSTSRFQVESLAEKSPVKVISKVTQQAVAAASRHASLDLDRVFDEKSLNTEMRSQDLDHNKLPKAMKSFRRVDSSNSSKYPDLISMSTPTLPLPRSPPGAPQAGPHGGLSVRLQSNESQRKSRNFLEQSKTSKSMTGNWNERDLKSKAVTVWTSDGQGEPMANSNSFHIKNLPPLLSHNGNSYGARNNEYPTTTGDLSPVSSSLSSSAQVLSPSRYLAGSHLLSDESGWRVKSSGSEPFTRTFSDMHGECSLETTNLEEEIRQCLEKSRLLMCDATSREDKCCVPVSPASREASFSVLALSRHRRSMERNISSVGSIPAMQKNEQEWTEPQDHLAAVSYVENSTVNIQTSKIDEFAKVEARRRIDDNSIVSLQRLNKAVIAYDNKYAQPACDPEARDNFLGSSPSLPRRSRFFEEANCPRFYKVT